MEFSKVKSVVQSLYKEYFPPPIPGGEIDRQAFNVWLIRNRLPDGAVVADIGGGWGLFATACQLVGLQSITIDDALDVGFFDVSDRRHEMPAKNGVRVVTRDVIKDGLGLEPGSIDAFTSFDSMEHWHHSPKRLFQEAVVTLKPGGLMLIGTPNAANLRKRAEAIFGLTEWSAMVDWYEQPIFRGHVREPTVRDYHYIAKDIGLEDMQMIGRNFQGYNFTGVVKLITTLLDRPMQMFPTLCSDIYMLGRKRTLETQHLSPA